MEKTIYITLFTVLGFMVATMVHAAIEIPLLSLISNHYGTHSGSFWWQNWDNIHRYGGLTLWLVGSLGGLWSGFRYWRIVYIEKRFGDPRI